MVMAEEKKELYVDAMMNNWEPALIGHPEGEPFVVSLREPSHIPMNAVVFALDAEDAERRVRKWIENRCKNAVKSKYDDDDWRYNRVAMFKKILDERGLKVEKFDKRYSARAEWASNGGFI
jgi:hypothetical protein